MNRNLRLLLVFAFIIIIVALLVVFVVLPGSEDDDSTGQTTVGSTNQPGRTPEEGETVTITTPVPTVEFVQILIATQNLTRGATIPPDAVTLAPWPAESVLQGMLGPADLENVIGARARTNIFANQPVLDAYIIYDEDLSELAQTGSDLSLLIPANRRAIAVPTDRLTSVAYGLQAGDRVDIIVSLLFVELDQEFQSALPNDISLLTFGRDEQGGIALIVSAEIEGRVETIPIPVPEGLTGTSQTYPWPAIIGPIEDPRPRLLTQMTIQDALVLAVDDLPLDGVLFGTPTPAVLFDESAPPTPTPSIGQQAQTAADEVEAVFDAFVPPNIAVLAVSPQDAVVLTYFIEARLPITFVMRPANEVSPASTSQVTLDTMMSRYSITLPQPLDYSIQPAIRSIRQLVLGDDVNLFDIASVTSSQPIEE